MNKRIIKWEKFHNPLLNINDNGEEDNSKIVVRATPFGPEGWKLNPDFPSEKVYIGHTNFDLDEDIKNILDNIDGVEILEIYSPYRMRITIGKAFNAKKIRRIISETLCNTNAKMNFDEQTNVDLYRETLKLNRDGKPWAIYVLPNGKYENIIGENEQDLENKISHYENIRNSIGGTIIS